MLQSLWERINGLGDAPTAIATASIAALIAIFTSFNKRFAYWWNPSTYSALSRKEIERDKKYFVPSAIEIDGKTETGDTIHHVLHSILLNKDEEKKKLFAILAPTGIGKTIFLNQIYLRYEKYSRRKNAPLLLYGNCIDLGTNEDLKNFSGLGKTEFAKKLDNLFENSKENSNFLTRAKKNRYTPENTILLLDGFDEDRHAFGSNKKAEERLKSIATFAQYFKKVLLVSRIQFFDTADEQPGRLALGLHFHRLYLQSFDTVNVGQYINLRQDWNLITKTKIRDFIHNLPEEQKAIYTTPFVLSNIESVRNKLDAHGNPLQYFYDIYNAILEAWEKREDEKFDGNSEAMAISERIALKILTLQRFNPSYGDFVEKTQIEHLEDVDFLEKFGKSDRTFLRLDGDKFSFAHRSIFEFFVAEIILGNPDIEANFDFAGYELAARIIFGKRWKDTTIANVPPQLQFTNDKITKPIFFRLDEVIEVKKGIERLRSISENITLHELFEYNLPFALKGQKKIKELWYELAAEVSGSENYIYLKYFKHINIAKFYNINVNHKELSVLRGLTALKGIDFSYSGIFDDDLINIRELNALEELNLSISCITDSGLANLRNLVNLRCIGLSMSDISDSGLEHLTKLHNLREIYLNNTEITNFGIQKLNTLKKIEILEISGLNISNDGIKFFKKNSNLSALKLDGTKISDDGLENLKNLISLEKLSLSNITITNVGLKNLKSLHNLTFLDLSHTGISDIGLENIKNLTNLQWLDLEDTHLTGDGLKNLKNLTKLKYLNLSGTKITDEYMKNLECLNLLDDLNLSYTKITDNGLIHLKNLSKLIELGLIGTQISDIGLQNFIDHQRLKTIFLEGTQIPENSRNLNILKARKIYIQGYEN